MRWRVLATSAPKWATVLSGSRKCKRGMRSAQLGGEGLSSWYGSKNRPDAGGREHRHGGLGLHTAADVHYGRAAAVRAGRAQVLDAAYHAHPERFVRKPPRTAETARHILDQPAPGQGSRHSVKAT